MKSNKFNKRLSIYVAITLVPFLAYVTLFIFPILKGIELSFTDWNGLTKDYNYIGFTNYINLFITKRSLNSLIFTSKYAILLVAIVMTLAMVLTLILTYVISNKMRTFYRSVFFFPAVLSLVTVGLTWNQIFYRVFPVIGETFQIDFLTKSILGDPKTAIWGILIVNIWQGTAIPFVLLLAGIQNVPKEMYEAAKIDGANPVQIFKSITIPFMLPVINVAFVMVLKGGLTVFDYIQAMTAGGPMRSTESSGVLIYQLAFTDNKAGFSSSYAVLLLVIIATVSIIQMKISSKVEVGQL